MLEDCHWLDPLSHDLLTVLGRALAGLPVLLLLAYRPPETGRPRRLRVSELPHFTEIRLAEFTPAEAERLIRLKLAQFFGRLDASCPAGLVERDHGARPGQPLLHRRAAELPPGPRHRSALTTLAAGGAGSAGEPAQPGAQPHRPAAEGPRATLQRGQRRRPRLPRSRAVGRPPALGGAGPGAGRPWTSCASLDLTPVDNEPEQTYLFKHIVTQEVAYESLPFATRAVLHDAIAGNLERARAADTGASSSTCWPTTTITAKTCRSGASTSSRQARPPRRGTPTTRRWTTSAACCRCWRSASRPRSRRVWAKCTRW